MAAASKTKKKTVTIGHASVTLSGGQSKTVSVALNSTGRALLKREQKLHVKLLLTQTSAGKTVAVKGQTRLHRPEAPLARLFGRSGAPAWIGNSSTTSRRLR